MKKTNVFRFILVFLLASAWSMAQAQMIDDVEIRREGADAVVQVRLVAPIQYLRSVTARSGDLAQAFYNVLPRREPLNLVAGERRLVGGDGLPQITITDESVGRSESSRKLIVRLSETSRVRVRTGRGNRSIDFVLEGRGAAIVAPAQVKPLPDSEPGKRYVLTLQSSVDPSLQLDAPIPKSLQEYQVMTSRRVVDGRTLYEINLGYFTTRSGAEQARALVLKRFPQTQVMALAAPETEPGAAVPRQDLDLQATELLAVARAAVQRNDAPVALEMLNRLLELPPNRSSREAQELVGLARLQAGEAAQARAEFELFLKLYPTGADADRVRQRLAGLPVEQAQQEVRTKPVAEATITTNGSVSTYYYGGKSKVRNQEFQDSALGGLVELPSDQDVSGADQRQLVTNVDLNWRQRNAERDVRFVFRDAYTADYMAGKHNRNRLSALYVDYRSLTLGTSVRLGRQSATGGGVLGRFDGVQAGYTFAPRWKVNAVAGVPTDRLLDSRRRFYGVSLDAEALTPHLGGSLYFMQQQADSQVDRRAIGSDLRYFNGGASLIGSLDYDLNIRGFNVASLQGSWTLPDTTTFNMMWDRRATPLLMLSNGLFFPTILGATAPPRTVDELLTDTRDLSMLRSQIKASTPYMTQAMLGMTTPLTENWQIGTDIRLTNIEAVPAVPEIDFPGQASTGNLWSLGGQLIGSNLYSARDTHVFSVSYLAGPEYRGYLASYNNLSALNETWQLEPSLRYFSQRYDAGPQTGVKVVRWAPGLRVGYRVWRQVTLETEASVEISKTQTPTPQGTINVESAQRMFYYVGGRYDF